jgi:hypothetical protein
MSHFSAIGMPLSREAVLAMLPLARPIDDGPSSLFVHASGGALAFHIDGGLACVTPFFVAEGATPWHVSAAVPVLDADCVHCSGADCDLADASGEMLTRATIQWLAFEQSRALFAEGRAFALEVVAFAHGASFCAPADFEAVRAEVLSLPIAQTAFLPTGMFGPASPVSARATSIFSGEVELVCRCAGGAGEFSHVRVRSLPGAIDVVLEGAVDAEPGQIALVEAWFVGRPLLPGPA